MKNDLKNGNYYDVEMLVKENEKLYEHIETLQKGFNAVNEDLCDTAEELEQVKYQLEAKEQKIKDAIDKIKKCACYSEKDKKCKCGFDSIAMDNLLEILGGEENV